MKLSKEIQLSSLSLRKKIYWKPRSDSDIFLTNASKLFCLEINFLILLSAIVMKDLFHSSLRLSCSPEPTFLWSAN